MKIYKLLYGIISWALLLLMIFPTCASAAKPVVAVLPLDTSQAGNLAFTGPAIQQMLISRLASEELDVMPAGAIHSLRDASKADYMVTGQVVRDPGNRIKVELELKSHGSQSPVEAWEIKPASIGSLVTETGRYSILIAQKISDIENQKTILSSLHDTSSNVQNSDESLMEDEQLKLSRIHPDLLYRETPRNQKGSASPIDKVPMSENTTSQTQADIPAKGGAEGVHEEQPDSKSASAATDRDKTSETQAEAQEDDNWPPEYPPVYDDELSRQQKAEAGTTGSEDDDSFAGDYPPEYDSSSEVPEQARAATTLKAGAKKKERSWWSYLWPFGNDQQEGDEGNVVQEPRRNMPKPVPANRLPYPVPADINAAMEADSTPSTPTDPSASLAQPEISTYPNATDMENLRSTAKASGAGHEASHPTSRHDKSAKKVVSQKGDTTKHSGGWFSWLWPDSWKGEDSEPAGTGTDRTLGHEDEQKGPDSYKASSEPPPEQNGTKRPVWVWN